jgi:dTDP-4-dehydrorhamnose reductase
MLRLGKEKKLLGVIFDQMGTPTYAKDLAETCLNVLAQSENWKKDKTIYHYSNEGVTSWFDLATAIMDITETPCKISPIETHEYPTKAKRPQYSVLNKKLIKEDFGIKIRHWRLALKEMLNDLN